MSVVGGGLPGSTWDALLAASQLPRLDARALLEQACGQRREWLLAHGDEPATRPAADRFEQMVARRRAGEPLAYVLGHREFHGRRFTVNTSVLVPRPETEGLVDAALQRLPDGTQAVPVLELGTGSGVIAITLALSGPRMRVVATDISADALRVAQGNAQALGAPHIDWHQGSWFDALPAQTPRFSLIVSNPPYLADDDPHFADPALRHEPRGALACGPNGMEAIEHIVPAARAHLLPGGWLLLEHGALQGRSTRDVLEHTGFESVHTLPDLQGLDRVTLGRQPG